MFNGISKLIQSNLSLADMLHNGHLVIANTYFKEPEESRSNSHRETLYSGHFYSEHLFEWHMNISGKIYFLIAVTL